jgi:hypothetical protein
MSKLISHHWHDGSFFQGKLENNIPEGKGLYVSQKGRTYEGLWSNGFSYGLYRNWLEEELNSDDYKFLLFYESYIEMSNSFYDGVIAKLTRYDSPTDIVMTYTYAERLISFGDQILDDLRELLCDNFAAFSQSDGAGDRAYSCGGRFSLPNDFSDKILEIALSIKPFNSLQGEISKTRSAIEVYKKLIESYSVVSSSPIGLNSIWNERSIFHKTLRKIEHKNIEEN